jgi:hypothetical protein
MTGCWTGMGGQIGLSEWMDSLSTREAANGGNPRQWIS